MWNIEETDICSSDMKVVLSNIGCLNMVPVRCFLAIPGCIAFSEKLNPGGQMRCEKCQFAINKKKLCVIKMFVYLFI